MVSPSTVLLVEDDPDHREVLRRMLVALDLRVVEASNGQEGLDRLPAANPDVVLTDLRMPVMDGFELARRIRQDPHWRHLRIIAVTAFADASFYRRTVTAFDAQLVKPVTSEALAGLLGMKPPRLSPAGETRPGSDVAASNSTGVAPPPGE